MKIKREDAAISLDGLLPVKMRCSNLASEALSETIYDYYKKKDIPILEELEKKHERQNRNHEHLEQRYGEFMETDKKLEIKKTIIFSKKASQGGELVTRDPVCNMTVDEKTTKWKTEHEGKSYFFCSEMCLKKFNENPEKYMK